MTSQTPTILRRLAAWEAPVLRSVAAAIDRCRGVRIDFDALARAARWLAWREYPPIDRRPAPPTDVDAAIDMELVTTAINFAYTDFDTRVPWAVVHDGQELVDADAMFLRFRQARAAGVPVTSGAWLAGLTEDRLGAVLHGPRPIPMLAERVGILRAVGERLVAAHDGHFSTFVHAGPARCYAGGNGLVERLVAEFPWAFDDAAVLHGAPVRLDKLVQLGVWQLHRQGLMTLEDLAALTAFADYIVPAALRAMGVLVYSTRLAAAVDAGTPLPAGEPWEVEIRVATVQATALLTEAINDLRPPGLALVIPQLDYRLWTDFHALIRPHHLTRTTRY